MGKASSSKKVARAAGIGVGRRNRRVRTPVSYLGIIALIVVLGIVGTVASRERRLNQINAQGEKAPTVGTVWNEGYAVYECGSFVAPITSIRDPEGIHTGTGKYAGIINIHPTVKSAAGSNATLGKFASAVGMKLNAGELQVPGGKLWQNGDTCEGQHGQVFVKEFNYVGDKTGQVLDQDPSTVLLADQALVTIAFVPPADKNSIPAPPAYVGKNLTALEPTTVNPTTTTTVPST